MSSQPHPRHLLPRYLLPHVQALAAAPHTTICVSGPRQVGKTTMIRALTHGEDSHLSWDVAADRERILRHERPAGPWVILDELHRYRDWRRYLASLSDVRHLVVTGSGRLDLYDSGRDSPQRGAREHGRMRHLRLHPLSASELRLAFPDTLNDLLTLGGFPEPFLSGSAAHAKRWARDQRSRVVREDVPVLERVQDLGALERLLLHLPDRVGAPLSINALRHDLGVSHKAVQSWLAVLERLFVIVRLSPFVAPGLRAVTKEQKHYHLDWSIVPGDAARFENLVAGHLLKWVHHRQDIDGLDLDLRYFRDTALREVAFVVTDRDQPVLLVDTTWTDAPVTRGLRYLRARFPQTQAWQIAATGTKDYVTPEGIRVAPALQLLSTLV